jgi:trigger factor
VKKKTLPEIDDDLAKDLGADTLSDLKEQLKEKILSAKENHVKRIQKAEILNKLIESHPFDVPESMVKRQLETLMIEGNLPDSSSEEGQAESGADAGGAEVSPGEPSSKNTEELSADMKEKYQEKALQIVKASVLIDMIGKQEGIIVTDNEVDERISLLAQNMSATPEAVRNFYMYQEGALDRLKKSVFEDKVLDMLLSKATIEKEENE